MAAMNRRDFLKTAIAGSLRWSDGVAPALVVTSPVKQVDHVMFVGGPELHGLVTVLRDTFELPVVFDGPAQTPPSPGIGVGFGNVTLEVVPLAPRPGEAPRSPRLGSLALQATDFPTTVDVLRARQIDHLPPEPQARWTTIGLRGFGGGLFFIHYQHDMDERRERFRRVLETRSGGALGVVKIAEIPQVRENVAEVRPAWIRLLGEQRTGDVDVWAVGDGPAIRLVAPSDPRANRIVVAVRNLSLAATALRRLKVPFVLRNATIEIDAASLHGLNVVLSQLPS
jgi:hypothetical protein